ncbi:MAG: hypothetical protein ABL860_03590 [Candidatus Nitrotoga sp.]
MPLGNTLGMPHIQPGLLGWSGADPGKYPVNMRNRINIAAEGDPAALSGIFLVTTLKQCLI